METKEIIDKDVVSRTLLDPKDIALKAGVPQLDLKNNFQFQINKKTGLREESVNCMRLFAGDVISACHEQGQEKCNQTNLRRASNPDAKQEQYYGYVSANVGQIRDVKERDISFTVKHTPQNDNDAHCDVVMMNGDEQGIGKQIRKAAKDKLVKYFDTIVIAP
ncbi:MAG: hypothetical protein ACRBDI_03420 [Alphaproteobacteria bacterium]